MPKRWATCRVTGKRSFPNELVAGKALGQAQTYRKRKHQSLGAPSLRGLQIESRYYECDWCDGFHLTSSPSRRRVEVAA